MKDVEFTEEYCEIHKPSEEEKERIFKENQEEDVKRMRMWSRLSNQVVGTEEPSMGTLK